MSKVILIGRHQHFEDIRDLCDRFGIKVVNDPVKDTEEDSNTHTIKARECPDCDKLKIPGIQCKNPLTGEFNCHPDLTFKPE